LRACCAPRLPKRRAASRKTRRARSSASSAPDGGREVTVIDHLGHNDVKLERWLKAFKTALAAAASSRTTARAQDDQRDRVRRLLTERGVKRVSG
jgi:translation initiation factor 1 (eIF-1/SUI1)